MRIRALVVAGALAAGSLLSAAPASAATTSAPVVVIYDYTRTVGTTSYQTIITLRSTGTAAVEACRQSYVRTPTSGLGALNCEPYRFTTPGDSARFTTQLWTWVIASWG